MERDLGHWTWFTAIGALFVAFPLFAIVLGVVLRLVGWPRSGSACIRAGAYGYVTAATATFTIVGVTFFTYLFHWWDLPGDHKPLARLPYILALSSFVIIPLIGLFGGAAYGVFTAIRANRPNQSLQALNQGKNVELR